MNARPKFSDEERALLDAIHDDPHDDGPYLAYADWLEGHGHPMGEFIRLRLGIEGRKVGEPTGALVAMRARAEELLAAFGTEWARPVSREFGYRGYTIKGLPYAQGRWAADFGRADGWLRRMSPRLMVGVHCICDAGELADWLGHPLLRRVHCVRFYLWDDGTGRGLDKAARLLADARVLQRCFEVFLRIATFSALSDEGWAMLAERFRDHGFYEVDSYAGDMPSSEFVGRHQPYDPYAIVSTVYRFRDAHPSTAPSWVRRYRRLTERELDSPECRERRSRAGIFPPETRRG
jgi:uncharacterized protein (TIGR02996 family)